MGDHPFLLFSHLLLTSSLPDETLGSVHCVHLKVSEARQARTLPRRLMQRAPPGMYHRAKARSVGKLSCEHLNTLVSYLTLFCGGSKGLSTCTRSQREESRVVLTGSQCLLPQSTTETELNFLRSSPNIIKQQNLSNSSHTSNRFAPLLIKKKSKITLLLGRKLFSTMNTRSCSQPPCLSRCKKQTNGHQLGNGIY